MISTIAATAPVSRRVRAYFAPVNREAGAPTIFDAAQNGAFELDDPPEPWIDLGWCAEFMRKSETKVTALQTGAPAMAQVQMRTEVEATMTLQFESWGKLQLALASGSQQMNLLQTSIGAAANGSGGTAVAALPIDIGSSTPILLNAGAGAAFSAGDMVAVDLDYTGQIGFLGSGVSAAYVRSSAAVGEDANYIRRVTLNVGRVIAANDGLLQLASPLPAGQPVTGMKVSRVVGFVDREGGSFFQEWSGLFVFDGEQGDRVIFHYPRLQAMQGATEVFDTFAEPLKHIRLAGAFRTLPVKDMNDSEMVLCFRSYLPGSMRTV